jgi:hypothetical protein
MEHPEAPRRHSGDEAGGAWETRKRGDEEMNGTARIIAAALVTAGLTACDEATGPRAGSGQVEAAAIGDASTSSGSASAPDDGSTSTAGAEGTVHFRARVYLWSDAGQWVEVTNGAAAAGSVDASGSDGAKLFASSAMEARSYTRVRVVFEDVRAEMTGDVQIGVGTTITGNVSVEMGDDGSATVEREIDLRVRGGSTARLVIDLNSNAWITLADPQIRTVSRTDFVGAVRVRGE